MGFWVIIFPPNTFNTTPSLFPTQRFQHNALPITQPPPQPCPRHAQQTARLEPAPNAVNPPLPRHQTKDENGPHHMSKPGLRQRKLERPTPRRVREARGARNARKKRHRRAKRAQTGSFFVFFLFFRLLIILLPSHRKTSSMKARDDAAAAASAPNPILGG